MTQREWVQNSAHADHEGAIWNDICRPCQTDSFWGGTSCRICCRVLGDASPALRPPVENGEAMPQSANRFSSLIHHLVISRLWSASWVVLEIVSMKTALGGFCRPVHEAKVLGHQKSNYGTSANSAKATEVDTTPQVADLAARCQL